MEQTTPSKRVLQAAMAIFALGIFPKLLIRWINQCYWRPRYRKRRQGHRVLAKWLTGDNSCRIVLNQSSASSSPKRVETDRRARSAEGQPTLLLQLRVPHLGFFQDGDIRVGVFPKGEEVFISSERPYAGGIGIRALRGSSLQSVGTSHS